MAPFLSMENFSLSRRVNFVAKYKSFKQRHKGTAQGRGLAFIEELLDDDPEVMKVIRDVEERRVLDFIEELLDDPEVISEIWHTAHKAGREAGFVEAARIMGVLMDTGEKPTDADSARIAMSSISDRISEFLPMRWKPISEVPSEGIFIGWNDGCNFFYVGHHQGERRCYSLDALINGGNYSRVHPTHFMPMPRGPEGAWDAELEMPDLSGMTWLIEALEPFSQMAGLLKRFHDKTKMEEIQITPMLNLYVADFERAEQALARLRDIVGHPDSWATPAD